MTKTFRTIALAGTLGLLVSGCGQRLEEKYCTLIDEEEVTLEKYHEDFLDTGLSQYRLTIENSQGQRRIYSGVKDRFGNAGISELEISKNNKTNKYSYRNEFGRQVIDRVEPELRRYMNAIVKERVDKALKQ
jgi:hypothetical protein